MVLSSHQQGQGASSTSSPLNRPQQQRGHIVDLTDEERRRRLEEQMRCNKFHRFVGGNLILKQGILDKKKGLWSRRRMFLLTEGPHLYYVDPDNMVLKGEIPWNETIRPEIRDFKIFFVHTPGRVYYLIDPGALLFCSLLFFSTSACFKKKTCVVSAGKAKIWCNAIMEMRKYYYGDSPSAEKMSLSATNAAL